MRRLHPRLAGVLVAGLIVLGFAAGARAGALAIRGGHWPLADRQAARMVRHSRWDPRRGVNAAANRSMPTPGQLRAFHAQHLTPYAGYVTGQYTGTTDEIIQWAARRWGFSPQLFRAVAAVESWWRMSTVGNGGTSFGLFQVGGRTTARGSPAS